ncbi:S-layer homology domain-containing protein [Desulfotruncus alcoholivorax]|uniref:S-layer homology domain-containing protein n=1 Tax=Desulfotruncus alcoholivorax TaxID=265477 RepID=UPI000408063F|nr:S-layer homology domain-containing protein [Desulfotruncus alcoholivorax]
MGYKKFFTVALTACLVLAVAGYALASGFTDIKGHWAEAQINKWAGNGLAGGYDDGTFRPDNQVSRAEFVALVNRAFSVEKQNVAGAGFKDVKAGKWYYNDVNTAKAAGYIGGYADGTFRPDQTITRQEAASILVRLLGLEQTGDGLDKFADAATFAAWSRGSIGAAAKAGLMGGFPDKTFKPVKSITRAETVVTLDRALVKYGNKVVVNSAIEGKVTFDDKAVAGAVVRVFKAGSFEAIKETKTGKDGKYKLALEAGVYNLTASTDQQVAYLDDVKVTSNQISTADLKMVKAAVLKGKLVDKSNSALKNTKMLFTTNPTFVTVTNSYGEYTVAVLPDRTYTVRAYDPTSQTKGPVIIKEDLQAGAAGEYATGTLKAPFTVSSAGGGGGGGGITPDSDPIVLGESDIKAGETYSDSRGYTIKSSGTFGPASGLAEFTTKLTLDPGAAGEVTLRNIKAANIEVLSGASSSVGFENVEADQVAVKASNQQNPVRIVTRGTTNLKRTNVGSKVILEAEQGSFGDITIQSEAANQEVELRGELSGSTITVDAPNLTITVAPPTSPGASTTVGTLKLNQSAAIKTNTNTTLSSVQISGNNASLNLSGSGTVTSITVPQGSTGTKITVGEGTIVPKLEINSSDVSLEISDPNNVTINVDDSIKDELIENVKGAAIDAISWSSSITYNQDNEDKIKTARNKVNAYLVLIGKTSDNDIADNTLKEKVQTLLQCAEKAFSDAKNLSIFASGDSAAGVTQDLTLPSTGAKGSNIVWLSSNASVVAANGKVTRQQTDVSVTLTTQVTCDGVTVTREFALTVKAGAPTITKFAGQTPVGSNISVSLSQINTQTGTEVSQDCTLKLTVEGLGPYGEFALKSGTLNNISNILVPNVNISSQDLTALFNALKKIDSATVNSIIAGIDFSGLFNAINKASDQTKKSVLAASNFTNAFKAAKSAPAQYKSSLLNDLKTIMPMIINSENKITIVKAIKSDALLSVLSEQDKLILFEALLNGDISGIDFSRIFSSITGADETTQNAIIEAIDFQTLFNEINKLDANTRSAVFNAINFTTLYNAIKESTDVQAKQAFVTNDVPSMIVTVANDTQINRLDLIKSLNLNRVKVESLYDWLKTISGNTNVVEISAAVSNNNGITTYNININK